MTADSRLRALLGSTVLVLLLASPAVAQIEEHLSAYTGRNATGYLKPLVDAFGADLNAGLFYSARIPERDFYMRLELRAMSVYFTDEDRTFLATTESGFRPETTTEAPTVIGSRRAVFVDGQENTKFAFPGGFDIGSFSFVVPQLRFGALYGTEAVVRFLTYGTGNDDLGNLSLYGVGIRHSINRYFGETLPIDLAASFFWQAFSMGENAKGESLVEAKTASVGIHASQRYWRIEPFAGIAYDTHSMSLAYFSSSTADEGIELDFESDAALHLTMGLSLHLGFANVHGEYNISDQNAFSIGLSFRVIE